MLFSQFVSRILAIVAILGAVNLQCAVFAQYATAAPGGKQEASTATQKLLLASTCGSCGAPQLGVVAAGFASAAEKRKNQSLLTDSLWGNLILELAYERDPELSKLAGKVRLMNFGTTASFFGIAGGTLAQGISALYVLNPPDGHKDSYAPLNVGVALSGAMMILMTARLLYGHHLAKHIRQRQIELRDRVQAVLAHLEYSQSGCADARGQLKDLIGERAGNEWIQLWQSSHNNLAQRSNRQISLHSKVPPDLVTRLPNEQ